jgi:hypothetical protein
MRKEQRVRAAFCRFFSPLYLWKHLNRKLKNPEQRAVLNRKSKRGHIFVSAAYHHFSGS